MAQTTVSSRLLQTSALRGTAASMALILAAGCANGLARPTSGPSCPGRRPNAGEALERLRSLLPPVSEASRGFLLGKRDPNGPSCVRMPASGSTDRGVPEVPKGDADGGVGLRYLQFAYWGRGVRSPSEEFAWQSEKLIPYLKSQAAESRRVSARLGELLDTAKRLREALVNWRLADGSAEPATTRPVSEGRLGFCLTRLTAGLARGDKEEAVLWAEELHAAAFALADLHRWVELLAANHLASLRVLRACEDEFKAMDRRYPDRGYSPRGHVSRFPGGASLIDNMSNLFEVERQAEGLFARQHAVAAGPREMREEFPAVVRQASVCLPPALREDFLQLMEGLSPASRAVLAGAAAAPYERSFVACALFRAKAAGMLGPLAEALRRFDRLNGRPESWRMMDILASRGGLTMSELEWGDRFDKRLMEMAGKIEGPSGRRALLKARELQYGVYGGRRNYRNLVLTLRRALNTGKMDCIRATDMIGALLRNAGQPGFGYVRVYRGVSGHCIAAIMDCPGPASAPKDRSKSGTQPAAEAARESKPRQDPEPACSVHVVDGLFGPGKATGRWPDYYTKDGKDRGAIAVELRGRGLIGAVFLEGVVLRGSTAGRRFTAAVPYLPRLRLPEDAASMPQFVKP